MARRAGRPAQHHARRLADRIVDGRGDARRMAEGARRPGTLPRRRGGPHPQRAEHRRDEPLVRGPAGPRSRIPIRGSGPRHARTAGVPEGRRSATDRIPRRDPPAPHGHAARLRGRTIGGAASRCHGRLRRNLRQRGQSRPVRTPVPLPRLHGARRRAEGRMQRDRRAPWSSNTARAA